METTRIPRYFFKMIIASMLFVFIGFHCSGKNRNASLEQTNNIRLIKTYPITTFSEMAGGADYIVDRHGNMYLTNLFARAIYKTKAPYKEFTLIGNRGTGPNEYLTPSRLFLFQNQLYYSDINNGRIKHIDLTENASNIHHNTMDISLSSGGGNKFVVDQDFVYVLNKTSPVLTIYSRKNGKKLNSFLEIDSPFNLANTMLNGGGLAIDTHGILYVAAAIPQTIYECKYVNNDLTIIDQVDLFNLPDIVTATENKLNKLPVLNHKDKQKSVLNSFTHVADIFVVENPTNLIVIHCFSEKSKNLYYILNEKGELVSNFREDKRFLLEASGNQMYFYTPGKEAECDTCAAIEEYRLNTSVN